MSTGQIVPYASNIQEIIPAHVKQAVENTRLIYVT